MRLLGQGGMGSVYEAEDLEYGRRVALKVLRHAPDSPTSRQRFLREGRLAASVNHPNSVYIYAAEEIEGAPVITMEYVPGGTLTESVRRNGPLPVAQAVDAILQIIAGLEAAAAKGVLHRDIKPSNCFIQEDGTVKIGDFGLSISTLSPDQTNLTLSGAIMGTPNYASPEQLRGDELDVRADIYSVGVTLFFLLTGQTPFNADNMVKLIATVLEKPAPSARELRREIPKALDQVVQRCLAKAPGQRYKDYHDLRRALLPFGSARPAAAPLGLRFMAGLIDHVVVGLLIVVLSLAWSKITGNDHIFRGVTDMEGVGNMIASTLGASIYFMILEGIWGQSAGKFLCRLRVIGAGGQTPGIARALARAMIYAFVPHICPALLWLTSGSAGVSSTKQTIGLLVELGTVALLFVTSNRRNGLAAIQDLLTGTRVVVHSSVEELSKQVTADEISPPSEQAASYGPFRVMASAGGNGSEEILLGYDGRLQRKVWIHRQTAGTPATLAARRQLNRKGRLHWLAGRRSDTEAWDAYEFVEGRPLTDLLKTAQSWESVRIWLRDLAEEFESLDRQQAVPPALGFDRVWITGDGRAKLLDFPAPGALVEPATEVTPQKFLSELANRALAPGVPKKEDGIPPIPMPMSARTFLGKLPQSTSLASLVQELGALLKKPAAITSSQRRVLIYSSTFATFMLIGILAVGAGLATTMNQNVQAKGASQESEKRQATLRSGGGPIPEKYAPAVAFGFLGCLFLPTWGGALLFRRGLAFRFVGIEIVTRDGTPARRWRTFLRSVLAWMPLILAIVSIPITKHGYVALGCLLSIIALPVYRIFRPGRPLRERITGTWLVPE